MIESVRLDIVAPYGLLCLQDATGDIPEAAPFTDEWRVARTQTSILFAATHDQNGVTSVEIGERLERQDALVLVYQGELSIPSRRFRLASIFGDEYYGQDLDTDSVRVSLWMNDSSEPSHIQIGVDLLRRTG